MLVVCLAFLMSTVFLGFVSAAQSEDPSEKTFNKAQVAAQGVTGDLKPKTITKVKPAATFPGCGYPSNRYQITKVKPDYMQLRPTEAQLGESFLPSPGVGRWEMSGGVLFARLRGRIAWPRYPWSGAGGAGWGGWTDGTDFTDGLQLPGHIAVPTWSVKYQFKPNWAVRYSGLGFEANGGGQPTDYIMFGPWQQYYGGYGQGIQTKYQHIYHRTGLVYDALKNYRSTVRVFAEWVHADDKIQVISSISVGQSSVFSKGTDAAMAGMEYQRLVKLTANGANFSCDFRAGGIFLDDVEGWDAQAAGQYTIPLNSGRSGYVKGGYRLVAMKKGQNDYLLKHNLEGGFMEFGFIF